MSLASAFWIQGSQTGAPHLTSVMMMNYILVNYILVNYILKFMRKIEEIGQAVKFPLHGLRTCLWQPRTHVKAECGGMNL